MLFDQDNYKWMGISFALVVIGFIAMYLENEVNGVISLFVSPILIVGGYALLVYAILKTKKSDTGQA